MRKGIFEVETPLGFVVRCTEERWRLIVERKHPVMRGRDGDVALALSQPVEVRRSRKDERVLLFYAPLPPRFVCAVVRRDDAGGFLVTAYPTDRIKEGERLWTG